MPRLRRVDCHQPGFTRRRHGRGVVYFDMNGHRITDAVTLERIQRLVIPPAWRDVWISPWPQGHIQATGLDSKGRRQYRYHDAWRAMRDREKFDHMLAFARRLPAMRETISAHLGAESLSREQVLACAARLLDLGFFRIGTEGYAEENDTYGLATILKCHVRLRGETVAFDYPAKGGKRRLQSVLDPDVLRVVAALKQRRGGGPALLAYRERTARGKVRWVDVRSEEINEYLRAVLSVDCSAKDFRTWNATVLAAVALAIGSTAGTPTARKRCIARAMQEVAHYLGNTPAVVRSSYVDPRLIDHYHSNETIVAALNQIAEGADPGLSLIQGPIEEAVLELLDPEAASEAA